MRILVVFTGGTIGCAPPDKGTLNLIDNSEKYYLIEQYKSLNPGRVSFDAIRPINVLSENMTIKDWNLLISILKKQDFSEYNGVIMTHGTDTMAYSAALFGFLLYGIGIPVVFVGSNYNLYDGRADGHQNFADAVSFICGCNIEGTFVIFKSIVYESHEIKQSKHFSDAYESVTGDFFGSFKEGIFTPERNIRYQFMSKKSRESEARPDESKLSDEKPLLNKIDKLTSNVLLIKPYTGLDYSVFNIDHKIKAVLHETYHSFTACSGGQETHSSIISFNKMLSSKNIPLYIAPYKNKETAYPSTNSMLESGLIPIYGLSLEAAYAKLLIEYNIKYT